MQRTTGVPGTPDGRPRGAPLIVAGATALVLGVLLVWTVTPSEAARTPPPPAATHPATAGLLPLPLPTLLPLPRIPLPWPLPLPTLTLLPPLPPLPLPSLPPLPLPSLPPVLPTALPTGLPLPSGGPLPPGGGPLPSGAPQPPGPSTGAPAPAGPGTSVTPGSPGRQVAPGTPAAPSADPRRGRAAGPEEARLLAEAPLPERLQVMGRNAVRTSSLPLGALLLLGMFLLLQDRVDRRDPKLALAPEYPEPHLLFEPPPDDPAPPAAARPDEPTETPR